MKRVIIDFFLMIILLLPSMGLAVQSSGAQTHFSAKTNSFSYTDPQTAKTTGATYDPKQSLIIKEDGTSIKVSGQYDSKRNVWVFKDDRAVVYEFVWNGSSGTYICNCITTRFFPVCGNGNVEGAEECDDGNQVNGDGCDNRCLVECTPQQFITHASRCPRPEKDRPSLATTVTFGTVGVDTDPEVTCYRCNCAQGVCESFTTKQSTCEFFFESSQISCQATCGFGWEPGPLGEEGPQSSCPETCVSDDVLNLPDVTVRSEGDVTTVSRCLNNDRVEYVVCGNNGGVTIGENECGEGFSCSEGACVVDVREPCVDTDGGVNLDIQGTVTGRAEDDAQSYSRIDYCEDLNTVREYSCAADGFDHNSEWINCDPGEFCEQGACVPGELPEPIPCVDTDGGVNPDIQGTVTGRAEDDAQSYLRIDYCDDPDTVREYSCAADGFDHNSEWINCDPGEFCEQGVCVPCSCSRTEANLELDPPAAGFVLGSDCAVQHDTCDNNEATGTSSLIIYNCGPEGLPEIGDTISCPGGCADGLCL